MKHPECSCIPEIYLCPVCADSIIQALRAYEGPGPSRLVRVAAWLLRGFR